MKNGKEKKTKCPVPFNLIEPTHYTMYIKDSIFPIFSSFEDNLSQTQISIGPKKQKGAEECGIA